MTPKLSLHPNHIGRFLVGFSGRKLLQSDLRVCLHAFYQDFFWTGCLYGSLSSESRVPFNGFHNQGAWAFYRGLNNDSKLPESPPSQPQGPGQTLNPKPQNP